MKKLTFALAATFLTGQVLSGCGYSAFNSPESRALQPHGTVAAQLPAVRAQSLSGINREISGSVGVAFQAKDANGDSFITPNEFPVNTPLEFQKFQKLDSNKDGKITQKEMAPGLFGRIQDIFRLKATAGFLFDNLDADGNKKLTKEEIGAATMPGLAGNFEKYLTKPFFGKEKRDYLRKTDFENLVAFVMLNPAAPAQAAPDPAPETQE